MSRPRSQGHSPAGFSVLLGRSQFSGVWVKAWSTWLDKNPSLRPPRGLKDAAPRASTWSPLKASSAPASCVSVLSSPFLTLMSLAAGSPPSSDSLTARWGGGVCLSLQPLHANTWLCRCHRVISPRACSPFAPPTPFHPLSTFNNGHSSTAAGFSNAACFTPPHDAPFVLLTAAGPPEPFSLQGGIFYFYFFIFF